MTNQLTELLAAHPVLYGIVCRDPTLSDVELYALAGYKLLWVDLEHGTLTTSRAVELCRSILQLGMVPVVRVAELSRGQLLPLLDGGYQVIVLPDVEDAVQVTNLVRMGKYPPLGRRGVSSTSASFDFSLGSEVKKKLSEANAAVHLMLQIESNRGLANLDEILTVKGFDLVTVGPLDWAVGESLLSLEGKQQVAGSVDQVLREAAQAGILTAAMASDPQQASHFVQLGARLIFVGVDITLKKRAFDDCLSRFRDALNAGD